MKSKGPKIFGTSAISSMASEAQQQQLNNAAPPMPGSLGGGSAISTIAGMFGKRQKKQMPQGIGASGIQGEAIDTMVGNSRGMMMKSPLKAGAYESGGLNKDGIDESVKSEDFTDTINDAVDTAAAAATDVVGTTSNTPKKDKKISKSKQARIDGRNERKEVRDTQRAGRITERNKKFLKRTKEKQETKNKGGVGVSVGTLNF